MKNLRYFLAKFLQVLYVKRKIVELDIPTLGSKLSHEEIQNLLTCVLPWTGGNSVSSISEFKFFPVINVTDSGHLSLHNAIKVTHPRIPGEVNSVFVPPSLTEPYTGFNK